MILNLILLYSKFVIYREYNYIMKNNLILSSMFYVSENWNCRDVDRGEKVFLYQEIN